jgi:hypothetical protein
MGMGVAMTAPPFWDGSYPGHFIMNIQHRIKGHSGECRNPVTSGYSGCRIKSGMTNSGLFAKPTTFGSFIRAPPLAKKTASLIGKETL